MLDISVVTEAIKIAWARGFKEGGEAEWAISGQPKVVPTEEDIDSIIEEAKQCT